MSRRNIILLLAVAGATVGVVLLVRRGSGAATACARFRPGSRLYRRQSSSWGTGSELRWTGPYTVGAARQLPDGRCEYEVSGDRLLEGDARLETLVTEDAMRREARG